MALLQFLALSFATGAAAAQFPAQEPLGSVSDDCHNACNALTQSVPEISFYGTTPPDFVTSYFSNQQRFTIPACIVRPTSAPEISSALTIITQYGCHFAVKSGGHASFKGASNSDGGITIDLSAIRELEISDDKATTRVGTGLRWGEVYDVLEPQGLTVIGGRDTGVGVGGFLLGGGISFLSRRYGWAMDNVQSYELVLANGSITTVSFESHPDLYWALRGGGNNFGIVSHFHLETYPQTELWGGNNWFLMSDTHARRSALGITEPFALSSSWLRENISRYVQKLLCAFGYGNTALTFLQATEGIAAESRGADPYSQLYMSYAYLPKLELLLGTSFLAHSKPVEHPPSFAAIKAMKPTPFSSTNRIANMSVLAKEINSWNRLGKRQLWKAVTFKANVELLSKILDIFLEESETIKNIPGVLPNYVMQPISQISMPGNLKKGGNPLGITEADGPLLMLSTATYWDDPENDEAVHFAIGKFLDRAVALGKEMKLHHPFIYRNYANGTQDVFGGYGENNRRKLRKIQKKYDPEGVFSKLQPGCFKL